jgi:hypothetical protein
VGYFADSIPDDLPNDEEIYVAVRPIRCRGERAEDESDTDLRHGPEGGSQEVDRLGLVAEHRGKVADCSAAEVDCPQPEIGEAAAADQTRAQEVRERQLNRMDVASSAPSDLAGVELGAREG